MWAGGQAPQAEEVHYAVVDVRGEEEEDAQGEVLRDYDHARTRPLLVRVPGVTRCTPAVARRTLHVKRTSEGSVITRSKTNKKVRGFVEQAFTLNSPSHATRHASVVTVLPLARITRVAPCGGCGSSRTPREGLWPGRFRSRRRSC